VRRSEGPVRQSEGPVRQSEGPVRQSEGPVRQSEGPVRQSEGPVRQYEGPVRQYESSVLPSDEVRLPRTFACAGSSDCRTSDRTFEPSHGPSHPRTVAPSHRTNVLTTSSIVEFPVGRQPGNIGTDDVGARSFARVSSGCPRRRLKQSGSRALSYKALSYNQRV
jgi:hypothetical protein